MKTTLLDPAKHGIELTEHGLRIKRVLSLDEWRELLSQTRRVHSLYHSVLSDITSYGRRTFGDDVVNFEMEQMEFDMADAVKAEAIALVGYDQRAKYNLTSEHAYVLGQLVTGDEEREEWARKCMDNELSAFELKKSIEAGEILREEDIKAKSGHSDGLPSPQSVRFQFERWQRQFKDPDAVLKLPVPDRKKILELLHPIIEFADKIENSISTTKP